MSPLALEQTYELMKEKIDHTPTNYRAENKWNVETADSITPQTVFARYFNGCCSSSSFPLWSISKNGINYSISKPILAKIYQDGAYFFAENETLALCGTGENPQDALQDLEYHIVYFFHHYRGLSEDEIMGDASRLKEIYRDLLIEE